MNEFNYTPTTGLEDTTYLPTGTRPLRTKIQMLLNQSRDYINNMHKVIDVTMPPYNADATGVSDSTSALQGAFDDINSSGGGKVIFPFGTYLISSDLTIYSNTIVESYNATLKLKAGTYNDLCFIKTSGGFPVYDSGYAAQENITIKGLAIDGNKANVIMNAAKECSAMSFGNPKNLTITDCTIKNLPYIVNASDKYGYGIISWYGDGINIERCTILEAPRQCINIYETTNARIKNCYLKDPYKYDCITLGSSTPIAYQETECIIENCTCINLSTTAAHVIRFSGYVKHGVVQNCPLLKGNSSIDIISLNGVGQRNIEIVNNIIDTGTYGIQIQTDTALRHIKIRDNEIKGCGGGILWNAAGGRCSVKYNTFASITAQPINMAYAADLDVQDNIIDAGTRVSLNASNSIIANKNKFIGLTDVTAFVVLTGAAKIIFEDNISISCASVIQAYSDMQARGNIGSTVQSNGFIYMIATNGVNKVLYGTSAPASGTWAQGDEIIFTNTAAGGAPGAKCVSGGTPGTWKNHSNVSA